MNCHLQRLPKRPDSSEQKPFDRSQHPPQVAAVEFPEMCLPLEALGSVALSLSLSFCPSVFPSFCSFRLVLFRLSSFICSVISFYIYFCLSFFLSVCVSVFLYCFLCLFIPFFPSLFLPFRLFFRYFPLSSLLIFLHLSLSLFMYFSLSVSFSFSLSMCFSIYRCRSWFFPFTLLLFCCLSFLVLHLCSYVVRSSFFLYMFLV